MSTETELNTDADPASPQVTTSKTAASTTTATTSSVRLVALTAFAPMTWGTTYLVSTEFLPADRPLFAGLMRALPAGIGLAAITRTSPRGTWWAKAALLGTLNIGGFFALLFYAAFALPGGVAATLGAIQLLVALALGAVLLGETIKQQSIVAGVAGMIGVGLLVLRAEAQLDTLGVVAGLVGALAMACGVVLTKKWGRPVGLLAFTSWQLIAGGLVLIPLTLAFEGLPPSLSGRNIGGFVWLTTVGTALAYSLWFRGVQSLPVAQVSILGLLSPVVAAIAGWLVLDQTMSIGQFAGLVLILGAVWLGQRSVARSTSAKP